MDNIDLLVRRNNWVVLVFAGIITTVQLLNLILGISFAFVATVLGIIYGILAPFAYISNRPRWKDKLAIFMKYFNLIVIGAFMFTIVSIDPHMINIMTIYFYVAVMGIYQDKIINGLTILITLAIVSYYFFTQGDVIFHSTNPVDLMYFLLTFCFVSLASILQAYFNNKLQKDVVVQKLEAIKSQEKLQQMLDGITHSLASVKEYQVDLNQATDGANTRGLEIVALLDEMLQTFDAQTEKSKELNKGMESTNNQVDDMTSSITEMHNYVESTKMATHESGKRIDTLENDLVTFNRDIQGTIHLMQELNEETESIEKIIQTISDISKQTNLLALNASIEAARAGEHGKGFAVVAEEVRKLAESSKVSSDSISELLSGIHSKMNTAANTISQSQKSIEKNTVGMVEVKGIFSNVDSYMQNISNQTKDLQDFILNVRSMMQEVGAGVEINLNTTEINKESLDDTLQLVSNQQKEIQSMSDGFVRLEQEISVLLDKR